MIEVDEKKYAMAHKHEAHYLALPISVTIGLTSPSSSLTTVNGCSSVREWLFSGCADTDWASVPATLRLPGLRGMEKGEEGVIGPP